MEYKIISTDSIPGTVDAVNVYIANGWKPVGGVMADRMNHFAQAMIRESEPQLPTAPAVKKAKTK